MDDSKSKVQFTTSQFCLFLCPCSPSLLSHSSLQGPGWLKNLYFAYLLVLRSVVKAESYWASHPFYTGDPSVDQSVMETVEHLIKAGK